MADTKQWEDNNGVFRNYKDEAARQAIATLNGDSSVQGSVAYMIAQALANFGAFQIVPSIESVTNPDGRVIYLVKDSTVTGDDKYSEYIYTDGAFAKIGETSLDLSGYVQFTDVASANSAGVVKIDGVTMEIDANGNISAKTVNGHTILSNVPANAVFTDTCNLSNATNILAITNGGTNASTAAGARTNLGLGTAATKGSTSSITENSTDLIESGAVYTGLDNKVDKVTGKGLSTNDFTTAEKTKLNGVESGAQVNTVDSVAGRTGDVTLSSSDISGLGTAATKASTNAITSGSTALVESGAVAAALGSTDISSIGDGTVKGAIGSLNSDMGDIAKGVFLNLPTLSPTPTDWGLLGTYEVPTLSWRCSAILISITSVYSSGAPTGIAVTKSNVTPTAENSLIFKDASGNLDASTIFTWIDAAKPTLYFWGKWGSSSAQQSVKASVNILNYHNKSITIS